MVSDSAELEGGSMKLLTISPYTCPCCFLAPIPLPGYLANFQTQWSKNKFMFLPFFTCGSSSSLYPMVSEAPRPKTNKIFIMTSDSLLFCLVKQRKHFCLYLLCQGFGFHQYWELCLVIEANRMNAFVGSVYFENRSHYEVMYARELAM